MTREARRMSYVCISMEDACIGGLLSVSGLNLVAWVSQPLELGLLFIVVFVGVEVRPVGSESLILFHWYPCNRYHWFTTTRVCIMLLFVSGLLWRIVFQLVELGLAFIVVVVVWLCRKNFEMGCVESNASAALRRFVCAAFLVDIDFSNALLGLRRCLCVVFLVDIDFLFLWTGGYLSPLFCCTRDHHLPWSSAIRIVRLVYYADKIAPGDQRICACTGDQPITVPHYTRPT
jgi:hypothetical protein